MAEGTPLPHSGLPPLRVVLNTEGKPHGAHVTEAVALDNVRILYGRLPGESVDGGRRQRVTFTNVVPADGDQVYPLNLDGFPWSWGTVGYGLLSAPHEANVQLYTTLQGVTQRCVLQPRPGGARDPLDAMQATKFATTRDKIRDLTNVVAILSHSACHLDAIHYLRGRWTRTLWTVLDCDDPRITTLPQPPAAPYQEVQPERFHARGRLPARAEGRRFWHKLVWDDCARLLVNRVMCTQPPAGYNTPRPAVRPIDPPSFDLMRRPIDGVLHVPYPRLGVVDHGGLVDLERSMYR